MSQLAVALLAAGRSARFGAADKLTAAFRGKALGLHAAKALVGLDFLHRWVIVRAATHPGIPGWQSAGFEPVVNAGAAAGMGTSLRCAAIMAERAGVDGLLVCLADMPLVPAAHYAGLVKAWEQHGGIVASRDGPLVSPPAIFPRADFAALASLDGDQGAKRLLGAAVCVTSPPGALADVDDPAALLRLTALR